jgi:hypothetical protein
MKTDHTVTTTTATKDKKNERERERRSCTHTHAHQHQHHQNGTRDEVKKRKERERQTKKTAHKRETWWLNNEQKIHTNFLIQVRRSRETKRKKMGKARKKERKQTNK